MGIIAIASDHAGVELKAQLKDHLARLGHDVIDLGPENTASVDSPDYADKLVATLKEKHAEQGVVICGSGTAISRRLMP